MSAMREFIARYARTPDAGELVVQAYWRIAQCRQQIGLHRGIEHQTLFGFRAE